MTENSASFEFRYAKPEEGLYKVHLSTSSDFSWDVYFNFTTGPGSPLVQENPQRIWPGYDCGAVLYWRLEAVTTGGVLSGVQGPVTVQCGGGEPPPQPPGLPPPGLPVELTPPAVPPGPPPAP